MRHYLRAGLVVVVAWSLTVAQQQPTQPAASQPAQQSPAHTPAAASQEPRQPAAQPTQQASSTPSPAGGNAAFALDDATPVKLRIGRTVSSADAQVGETVDFEVLEEIKVGDLVVIPKGGLAWATVTEAQPKRRLGRAGKLGLNIDSVKLADGEKAALRAVKDVKGAGHGGAVTGAVVATALVFWPAAPLFLLIHGKDITIPKGTEITAYINGAMPLDRAKFEPAAKSPATATAAAPAPSAQLQVTSDPDSADILVDGAFVGNTPSTVSVPTGEHDVEITKTGYVAWKRHLRVLGGDVHINAKLEPESQSQPK